MRTIDRKEDVFYRQLLRIQKEKHALRHSSLLRSGRRLLPPISCSPRHQTKSLDDFLKPSSAAVEDPLKPEVDALKEVEQQEEHLENAEDSKQAPVTLATKVIEVRKSSADVTRKNINVEGIPNEKSEVIPIKESSQPNTYLDSHAVKQDTKDQSNQTSATKSDVREPIVMELKISKDTLKSPRFETLPKKQTRYKRSLNLMPAICESENSGSREVSAQATNQRRADDNFDEILNLNSGSSPKRFGIITTIRPAPLPAISGNHTKTVGTTDTGLKEETNSQKEWPLYSSSTVSLRTPHQVVSLVEENRRRRIFNDLHRKRVLDNERLQLYERDVTGQVLPAIQNFRRRAFPLPSSKATRMRQRMRKELAVRSFRTLDRIDDFFTKLTLKEKNISAAHSLEFH